MRKPADKLISFALEHVKIDAKEDALATEYDHDLRREGLCEVLVAVCWLDLVPILGRLTIVWQFSFCRANSGRSEMVRRALNVRNTMEYINPAYHEHDNEETQKDTSLRENDDGKVHADETAEELKKN